MADVGNIEFLELTPEFSFKLLLLQGNFENFGSGDSKSVYFLRQK